MSLYLPYFCSVIVFSSLYCFLCQRRHVLIRFLCLEAVVLSLTLFVGLVVGGRVFSDIFYCFVILTFGACEASVALSILVIVTRSFGNDILSSLRLRKC
jgi:NADH:ubiquinone oxidoreductase subunit K